MKAAFLCFFTVATIACSTAMAQTVLPADGKELLMQARQRFDALRSYRCKAVNVVMKYGVLRPTRYSNEVLYSFEKPNKVRMTWVSPLLLKGQVAVYRDSELRVKMQLVPFAVRMDPDGLIAKDPAGNRIYHTHFGYLIDSMIEAITAGTKVDLDSSGAQDLRMQIENERGRVVANLDKETLLPISMEIYDPEGKLQQSCHFSEVDLDVEFGPKEFTLPVVIE